ncbi:MAG: UDP-N-acetylmuramoyl-L-alanine--D-glutamate ligase [Pseudomonadota bacterium]
MQLENKNVLVVGLGRSGVATARFLKRKGAIVTVTDIATEEALAAHVRTMREMGVGMELGQHRIETFERAELVVLSPGVPHMIPPIERARKKGIPVIGEVELAFRFIREPVIAITGTNGKTTTTELLGKMLTRSGVNVFVGGNIGNPLISYPDMGGKAEIVVAEISSFQLDTIETFRPKVGVLLNITDDHLDRYPDFSAYVRSKGRIFENQRKGDTAVLNGSDLHACSLADHTAAEKLYFCHEKNARSKFQQGAVISRDHITINMGKTISPRREKTGNLKPGTQNRMFLDLSRFGLPGSHNMENVAAAALAALAIGGTLEGIQSAMDSYKGLSHRLEFVAAINNVEYFNDSKATNVDSVARALECFTRPVILIMGGRNKGSNFHVLKDLVRRHAKKLIVMGEARDEIKSALNQATPTQAVSSMEDAVFSAYRSAVAGDVVLLAPACSSFDMYANYAERGESFCKAVDKLKRENT